MPGNVENIKGIGLSVVADATQIKRTFEEAIQGLRNKTVQMKLSVVKDGSVDRVLKEIRQTRVSVDVALHPTRDTIRQVRRDFHAAMSKEGGLPIPISIKAPTQQQGAALRAAIVRSIGSPMVDVILNPVWGKGGPSAAGFFSGGGGGQGGGFEQPVRAAQAPTAAPQAPRTGPGPRSGVSTRLASFQRRSNEAEDEWTTRLLQSRMLLLQRSNTATKQQTRARAAKAIAAIDKQLGAAPMDTVVPQVPPTERSRRPNKGGLIAPNVGLPTGPTDWEKITRVFYQNVARRQLSTPAFVGGDLGQEGLDQGAGRFRAASGRFISRTAYQENRRTRDRGQRVQMSFLQPGLGFSAEELDQRHAANISRVAKTRDISPGDELVRTLKGLPISFGDEFEKGLAKLQAGDLEGALGKHIGPGESGTGLRGALDSLLLRGRTRQIPGVGPRTVARVLDPTKDILPGPHAEQQAAYAFQVGALQDLIGATHEVQTFQNATAKPKRITKRHRANVAAAVAAAKAAGPMGDDEVMRVLGGKAPAPIPTPEAPTVFPHLAIAGGSVGGGGGGGGGGFMFGGHGGPVPVEVLNWPPMLEGGGTIAAQRVMPTSHDFERLFQEARESVESANTKLGTNVGAKKGAAARKAVKAPAIGTTLRQELQAGLASKGLTSEDVEAISERGSSRSAQEVLGLPGPSTAQGLEALRTRLAEARQGLPIRSPAVTIAQKFAGPQRGAITARLAQGGRIGSQIESIERENTKLVDIYDAQEKHLDTLNAIQASGTKLTKAQVAQQERLPVAIEKTRGALDRNVAAQAILLRDANKLAGLTLGEQASNLGRSFAGSIVGTIGYGAALGAVAGAGVLAFKALGPLVERSLGYQNVSAQITNNLAEQQKAQGGNVKMLVAQELATKNLTKANADLIAPALQTRATTQAGALSYQGQTEELAAGVNIQNAMAGNAGDRGGGRTRFSANPDLYTSSGGIFNSSLFAPQQSVQEAIARRIDLAGQGLGTGQNDKDTKLLNALGATAGAGGQVSGQFTPNTTVFQSFQNDVKATGLGLRAIRDRGKDLDKTFAALQAADLQEFANAAKASGIALQGLTGDVQKDAVAVTVLTEQLGKAAARRTPEQVLAGQADTIKGIRFGINQDLQNQLKTFLPAQRALSSLAQPQAPFGRSIIPLNNLADQSPFNLPQTIRGQLNVPGQVSGINVGGQQQFGGVPPAAIASFTRYRAEAQAAIDAVNAKAAEGERVLHDTLGVPLSTISQLRGFGQRIDEISQKQSNLQLGLQYEQYNHQLFIAKRTLGDIAGLVGKSGGTEIGILQREEMLLGRQNQALSLKSQLISQQSTALQLQLSQRQINFQRSIAGFTAPGLTPEERAARIEEAKIEADYAQKQLDFQKEQFALQQQSYELAKAQYENQIKLQDSINTRAFGDQAAAIAEMVKAFQTGVEIAALEELKSAISAQRDQLVADIQAQVGAEEAFLKTQAQFTADLLTQTGDWTVATVNKVAQVFKQITASLPPWLRSPSPTGTPNGQTGTNQGYVNASPRPHAAGMFGEVSRPTSLGYAGEAGKEVVAVIRNPRPIPMGMGMGGSGHGSVMIHIPITITGNSVRDDRDLTELASRVSRMVEVNLGRRASQFGLRVTR